MLMHPLPPEPVTSSPDEVAQALRDSIGHHVHAAVYGFWDWFDANTGSPHWFLPLAVGCYLFAAFAMLVMRLLGPDDEWWTTDPRDTSRVLVSDLRKDSEAADGPRSDREAKCPSGPDAPAVRRCRECAAPIDPVDDLLDGLFEDGDAEPGPTGWQPGMPPWGTRPLLEQENRAQAELFRQMITDGLRCFKDGPV